MADGHERLLVGVDGSPDSDRAVEWALSTAGALHAVLHVLYASPTVLPVRTPDADRASAADLADLALDRAGTIAGRAPDVPVRTERVATRAAEALVGASEGATAVVVGARGHGRLTGAMIGSVSQHVARHAAAPVVVVREPADRITRTIVVGMDPGASSGAPVDFALRLAAAVAAPVVALRAWEDPVSARVGRPPRGDPGDALRRQELARLNAELAGARARRPGVEVAAELVPGHPQRVLADISQHSALVVVGSRGRGGFAGLLLGSVSQALLQHAACPVAVVR